MEEKHVLFRISGLKKYFPVKREGLLRGRSKTAKANDGIDLTIFEGETLGLVGESGCGKSTFGRVLLRLYPPTSGMVTYFGHSCQATAPRHAKGGPADSGIDLARLTPGEMRALRREMQMIFQDPYASLNPRMTAGQIIGDSLTAHGLYRPKSPELHGFVRQVMEECGLAPYMLHRYPHECSGGQRQRISIARALALRPKFVVCDEAVSALDVSIQSQILNLLGDLKAQLGLTYLFISHNLSVVKYISDRIGVMYLGVLVELAPTAALFAAPLHPYTHALLSAIPTTGRPAAEGLLPEGDMPSLIDPPGGCKFHPRCPHATGRCATIPPPWEEVTPGHFVACHNRNGVE